MEKSNKTNVDLVLDDLESRIGKHIVPVGFGGRKLLSDIREQMNQMRKVAAVLGKRERT